VLSACLALPLLGEVKIAQEKDRAVITVDGKPYSTFFYGEDTNKPYLHPLRSASGKVVTRGYPMESIQGESKDHPHHRGLWFTHGDVNGFDFWANEPEQKGMRKGRVVLKKVLEAKSGKRGGIKAEFDWVDGDGKALLTETRNMVFHADAKSRTIDIDIALKGLQKSKFGDTKEGVFAIRLATPLEEKHTGKMISADGGEGEKNVWGKRSPWVDYSGEIEGEKLGIAIFDHPSSLGHPTYWHSRAYGLFAANIFGLHDFENDKQKDGSRILEPGQTWRFRYRVMIHPGDTQSANIAALYKDWAK
jgi:hypothetical protein